MKTLVVLLLIVITAGTVVPCCVVDNCNDEMAATATSHSNENDEKGNCSPFFACGTCAHAIEIISPVQLVPMENQVRTTHFHFYLSGLSTYHHSLFQPPRVS